MNQSLVLHIFISLMVISRYVESCSFPRFLRATVPQEITAGYNISKVNVDGCDTPFALDSSDPDFAVLPDGTILAVHTSVVPNNGRTLTVWLREPSGHRRKLNVELYRRPSEGSNDVVLRRSKRRWSPLPFNIVENAPQPFPKDVEMIASDSSAMRSVYYTISGPGVNEFPMGVFSVDKMTGMVRVHKAVDREEFPQFIFLARVFDRISNQETDLALPITVNVIDENDNAPTFTGKLEYTVPEHCIMGTRVGQVIATDRDDPATDHTKIQYALLSENNLFTIHSQTGFISTKTNTLDREVQDKHFLILIIRDKNGAPEGLSNTATATVLLSDINDNPPTFLKSTYTASVEENKRDVEILRIPIEDKDLVNTPNWNCKYVITKGNENGNFRIETDPKTNEGVLHAVKPLDYEKTKNISLEVQAQNQAELKDTTRSWQSIPINVAVRDVDEGPEFIPTYLYLVVKENTANGTLIGTYTATDPETKSSAGMKYYKLSDPASWITVDQQTGGLKVANTIDRESSFVSNGQYNVTVKAVDASSKSGTGTVIIQVEDMNDNVPIIQNKDLVVCEKDGGLGSVLLTAEDIDQPPFGGPFTYELGENQDGKWILKQYNGTASWLEQAMELPTGLYSVPVLVKDLQGNGKTQSVNVRICRCRNGVCLAHQHSATFGVWGILAMLALALLFLLCICLAFFCVTKTNKLHFDDVDGSGGTLLKSNTEALGEERPSNMTVPFHGMDMSGKDSMYGDIKTNEKTILVANDNMQQNYAPLPGGMVTDTLDRYSFGQFGVGGVGVGGADITTGSFQKNFSAYQTWQINNLYLSQKLGYFATEGEARYADDILHPYEYEGVGSDVGSLGCCSDLPGQDDLAFLNTLGPQFRTLAEVCTKK